MTEAGSNDDAGESGPPDLPLRAAAPARGGGGGGPPPQDTIRIKG